MHIIVIDKTERIRKMDADNSLEKFKGSLEGIFYKPDNKQVLNLLNIDTTFQSPSLFFLFRIHFKNTSQFHINS